MKSFRLADSPSRSVFVPHDLQAPIVGRQGGLLSGFSCAVKDSFDIAGSGTGGGNPEWLAFHSQADKHASAVERLLAAGTEVVGKTVCDEFFYSISGVNAHYGIPANPRAHGRLPGGSSSGSAAAAAAGACDFSLGTDTAGSVRIPAALCGTFGIRTTHDRVSLGGCMKMAPSFDTVGWFSMSSGLLRLVGDVLLDGGRDDSPLEKAVLLEDACELADADVSGCFVSAWRRMGDMLATGAPVRASRNLAEIDRWRDALRTLQAQEVWDTFGGFVTTQGPALGPDIADRMKYASCITSTMRLQAFEVKEEVKVRFERLLQPGTFMAFPTAPSISPKIDADPEDLDVFRACVMRLTCIASLCGLPQVSIPIGTVEGCPVGLSLLGWRGSDELLLRYAHKLARFCAT